MTTSSLRNTFMVALTGKTSGFAYRALNYSQNVNINLPEEYKELQSILTLDSEDLAILLTQLAYSLPDIANNLNRDFTTDFSSYQLDLGSVTNSTLVTEGKGHPSIKPTEWDYDVSVLVTESTDSVEIHQLDRPVVKRPCVKTGNILVVIWNDDLENPMTGRLVLPSKDYTGVIKIKRPRAYPVLHVFNALCAYDKLSDILEAHNLTDSFYFADSNEEAVCVVALALYKYFIALQQ